MERGRGSRGGDAKKDLKPPTMRRKERSRKSPGERSLVRNPKGEGRLLAKGQKRTPTTRGTRKGVAPSINESASKENSSGGMAKGKEKKPSQKLFDRITKKNGTFLYPHQ